MQARTPLFLYNGGKDTIVPPDIAKMTYKYLHDHIYSQNSPKYEDNYHVDIEAGVGHGISERMLSESRHWLT